MSRYLVGEVQDNGLLEGDCLLLVKNDETGEKACFPGPKQSSNAGEVVPGLLKENRFLEALRIADGWVQENPEDGRAHLLRAYVLSSLGTREWRREFFTSLELAVETSPKEEKKELAKRLKRAKLAKYEPARNPRQELLVEIFAAVDAAEPEGADLERVKQRAIDLVHDLALPPSEVTEILQEFQEFHEVEAAGTALKVWHEFYAVDPTPITRAQKKLLRKMRKRVRPTLMHFFKGLSGDVWPKAVSTYFEDTGWCPPGGLLHLSEPQQARYRAANRGCASGVAVFLLSWFIDFL